MSSESKIEWCDSTFNPWVGCTKISPGCDHCYAERWDRRFAPGRYPTHWGAGKPRHRTSAANWKQPERWNQPLRWRRPRRIFVCAHGDLFHPAVPDAWIDRVFAVMALAPQHTFQVLTKRPGRMLDWFRRTPYTRILRQADILRAARPNLCSVGISDPTRTPWSWVWLGVSVEDQPTADERIPLLLQTPAAVRFVSAEPLLGPVDLSPWLPVETIGGVELETWLDWVIAGGESGPGARPSHPDWFRDLRDQCQAAGVAFFFKQWGAWEVASAANGHFVSRMPDAGERYVWLDSDGRTQTGSSNGLEAAYAVARVGKRRAGRVLDGRTWDEFPRSAP